MLLHGPYHTDARVRREAEALAEAGFIINIVCTRGNKKEKRKNIFKQKINDNIILHILPIKKKRGNFLRYFYEFFLLTLLGTVKITFLHFKKKFDAIHIHNMPDILVLAGLIPKFTGAKLILDIHDPMVEHFLATYHLKKSHWIPLIISVQEKFSYLFSDKIITVSNTMGDLLEKKGIKREKISILHNFPDKRVFPLKYSTDKFIRPKDKFTMLYCGTITEHYRLDIAVRALKIASKKIPNIIFLILGTGNREEQVYELAKTLGVENQIEIIKPVPQEKVKEIMSKADVGITTHQGGIFGNFYFSTKILEYMTQGLPVISSRTKTIDEYIPDNAIFYFQPENVDDLVKVIEKVWLDSELVEVKVKKGIEITNKYNWDTEKEMLVNFYNNIFNYKVPRRVVNNCFF